MESKEYGEEEYDDLLDLFSNRHPEVKMENLRDCGLEVEKAERLMAEFESKHSLAELLAISELTPEEAVTHPVRRPAWADAITIEELVKTLKRETNIPKEKYDELEARRKIISNAVGYINNNMVDHNR